MGRNASYIYGSLCIIANWPPTYAKSLRQIKPPPSDGVCPRNAVTAYRDPRDVTAMLLAVLPFTARPLRPLRPARGYDQAERDARDHALPLGASGQGIVSRPAQARSALSGSSSHSIICTGVMVRFGR